MEVIKILLFAIAILLNGIACFLGYQSLDWENLNVVSVISMFLGVILILRAYILFHQEKDRSVVHEEDSLEQIEEETEANSQNDDQEEDDYSDHNDEE